MAISPVSSVNSNYNYRNLSFGEKQEETNVDNKLNLSTETKVLIGAGLTALAAVGIYIATRGKGKIKVNGTQQVHNTEVNNKDIDLKKQVRSLYDKLNIIGKKTVDVSNWDNKEIIRNNKTIKRTFEDDWFVETIESSKYKVRKEYDENGFLRHFSLVAKNHEPGIKDCYMDFINGEISHYSQTKLFQPDKQKPLLANISQNIIFATKDGKSLANYTKATFNEQTLKYKGEI